MAYSLKLALLDVIITVCSLQAQTPPVNTESHQDSVLAKLVKLENKITECLTQVKAHVHELQYHAFNIEDLQRARQDQSPIKPPPDQQQCICDSNDRKPISNILTSCKALKADQPSGKYMITVSNTTFEVYCEQKMQGGGWTVIQNRFDGTEDFYRGWTAYRDGFGDLNREFWLGLEKIYKLTSSREHELFIEAYDFKGEQALGKFTTFSISSETDLYKLSVSGQSGYRGLDYHNGRPFSTYDRDNDDVANRNCADLAKSGWWHKCWEYMNLNGMYKNGHNDAGHYSPLLTWWNFKKYNGLKSSKMMIREK